MEQLKQKIKSIRTNAEKNLKKTKISLEFPAGVKFVNALESNNVGGSTPEIKKSSTHPLTEYPLNTYQFLGMMIENNQHLAYLLGPDNITYQIKEGDVLGNLQGRVVKINDDHIEVLESNIIPGQRPKKRIVSIKARG